ncbi:uncharacterized protein LOC129321071 [Prosopis cineraria]|uniref:uncharacterized protein LOC129321071 n=1 Tax=Prosopis cineraria TaxID=364024 RepID=UPI00240F62B7|nr:uncharacterized protein LOC129321071 [Prosopis cineraria]
MSLFHYPPSFPFTALPHTDHSLAVKYEISEEDKPSNPTSGDCLEAIVELRIRQKYTLLLEPIKGQRVSLEDDYVVSPELTLGFKIPLWLIASGPEVLRTFDCFVSTQLASLPILAGLGVFLKPYIIHHTLSLARKTKHRREFKTIFFVMVSKIDVADAEECDLIRRRWSS